MYHNIKRRKKGKKNNQKKKIFFKNYQINSFYIYCANLEEKTGFLVLNKIISVINLYIIIKIIFI